jgi:hypothetical protein
MNAPVDVSFFARAAKPITSYRKYWASPLRHGDRFCR